MNRFIFTSFLFLLSIISFSQDSILKYETVIDQFVKGAHNNLSFSNGLNSFITKPKNDQDALEKGFETQTTDGNERLNKTWEILAAKDVNIENQKYRAVLYRFNGAEWIVLYYPQKKNEYYFRIFHAKWEIPLRSNEKMQY